MSSKVKKKVEKVKEKKRINLKLKKQIRLTLASVLLITAMVIALIPPEDLEASTKAAAVGADDNRGNVNYIPPGSLDESAHKFLRKPTTFDHTNPAYGVPNAQFKSYSIYPLQGIPDTWAYAPQFECSVVNNISPSISGSRVIINRFLRQLPSEHIEIRDTLVREYFTVSAEKFDNFFSLVQTQDCKISPCPHSNGDDCNYWDQTDSNYPDADPGPGGRNYKYNFKNWFDVIINGAPISTVPDMLFIRDTWPEAYAVYNNNCQTFYDYILKYIQWGIDVVTNPALTPPLSPPQPGGANLLSIPPDPPTAYVWIDDVAFGFNYDAVGLPLSLSPGTDLDEKQQYDFYFRVAAGIPANPSTTANHRHRIPVVNTTGFTLKDVIDSTSTTGYTDKIYIPRGPNTADNTDSNGFLIKQPMSALVAGIGDGAFEGYNEEYELFMPSSMDYIGNRAFADSFLTDIDLTQVKEVGDQSFYGCERLNEISLGVGTTKIGKEAFYGSGLLKVTLSSTIRNIGYGAFAKCDNLVTVDMKAFNQSKRVIDDYAFYNCIKLTEVLFDENSNSVFVIGEGAFAMPSGTTGDVMKTIVLPGNINGLDDSNSTNADNGYIGNYLFANRSGLVSVTMPRNYGNRRPFPSGNNLTIQIPSGMFVKCTGLEEVIFPNLQNGTNGGFASFETIYNAANIPDAPNKNYIDTVNKGLSTGDYRNDNYMGRYLFLDVNKSNFKVIGPEFFDGTGNNREAFPRISTWYAFTAVKDYIPYQFIRGSNGNEIFEISNGEYLLQYDEQEGGLTAMRLLIGNDGPLDASRTNYIDLVIPAYVDCSSPNDTSHVHTSDCKPIKNISGSLLSGDSQRNFRQRLRSVEIGGTIETIGDGAFAGCENLNLVTFRSPGGDYTKHQLEGTPFKTGSNSLVFMGDIDENYAPYTYAMELAKGTTGHSSGVRILYRSLSPYFLTVIRDEGESGDIVLMNYSKKNELDENNKEHTAFMERYYYRMYADSAYDDERQAFRANISNGTFNLSASNENYGPWIDEKEIEKIDKYLTDNGIPLNSLLEPYFKSHPYSILDNNNNAINGVHPDKPYKNPFVNQALGIDERAMYRATEEIVIPKGITSIDSYGYLQNDKNNTNIAAYFAPINRNGVFERNGYMSIDEYEMISGICRHSPACNDDRAGIIPGLFSGYYVDDNEFENVIKGNDQLRSITMYSITKLPPYAFDSCERLEFIDLGSAMEDIGTLPFRGCTSLLDAKFSGEAENDKYAIYDGIVYSKKLGNGICIEQVFPARGKGVGSSTYPSGTVESERVSIVSEIKPAAFSDVAGLNIINLNDSKLTFIPEECFKNSTGFLAIHLPRTVRQIEKHAFANISGGLRVILKNDSATIKDDAFEFSPNSIFETVKFINEDDPDFNEDNPKYWSNNWLWAEGNPWVNPFPTTAAIMAYFMDFENPTDTKRSLTHFEMLEGPGRVLPPGHRGLDNHTQNGWESVPLGIADGDAPFSIRTDTWFSAQYVSNLESGLKRVIFYDTVAGEILNENNQWHEVGAIVYPPPTKNHKGYEFKGWVPDGSKDGWAVKDHIVFNTDYRQIVSGGSGSNADDDKATFTVSVNGGAGSGRYAPGTLVMISAYAADRGKEFDKWTTASTGVGFLDSDSAVTAFAMPGNNVTVTATYKNTGLTQTPGSGNAATSNSGGNNNNPSSINSSQRNNAIVEITKPGIPHHSLASASVSGSTNNFVVKISDDPSATAFVIEALQKEYGSLDQIRYFPMDISLYNESGTYKITDTSGLSVSITIPLPSDQIPYGGRNKTASAEGGTLEHLTARFSTIDGIPCVTFTATHFSPYVIYTNLGDSTVSPLDPNPKTGDGIHPKWFLVVGLTCLSFVLFIRKERIPEPKTA